MEHPREEQHTPWYSEPPLVSVVARYEGTGLALALYGEADRYSAGRMLAELLSALRPDLARVTVDLTDLSFCDLAGSDALHAFVDQAGSWGISVELHGMSTLLALLYSTFPARRGRAAEDALVGSRPAAERPVVSGPSAQGPGPAR